ncbi:hypothetical protein MASR2M70_13640 [Bacillota bacterium]
MVAGGGRGSVSINGSMAVNNISNHVLAYIDASQVTSKSIILAASDSSEIGAIAKRLWVVPHMHSIGASVAVNCMGTAGKSPPCSRIYTEFQRSYRRKAA